MRFDASYKTAPFVTLFIMIFIITVESAARDKQSDFGFTHDSSFSPSIDAENHDLRTPFHKFKNDYVQDEPVRVYNPGFESPLDKLNTIPVVEQHTSALMTKEGIEAHIRPLRAHISSRTFEFLTSDVLSEPDPFQYLIHKTLDINYRDIPKMTSELRFVLSSNAIPESFIPYVQAMRSILSTQIALAGAKRDILEIQKNRSTPNGRYPIPSSLSSPPELSDSGLFSSEIFSDPEPPVRLINKLLQIPKRNIKNLMTRLENFDKRVNKPNTYIRSDWWPYIWYSSGLISFFHSEFFLDDLKRDMINLQRISTVAKASILNDGINNENN